MDWSQLTPLERSGCCLLFFAILAGILVIAFILREAIWKYYRDKEMKRIKSWKYETEREIEHPERIKVISYNLDRSLNYWERRVK